MFSRSNLGSENGKRKAMIVWYLLVVYAMLSGFWVGSTGAIGSSHGFLGCDGTVSDLPLSVKLLKIRGIHIKKEMSYQIFLCSHFLQSSLFCTESHEEFPRPFNIFSFCLMLLKLFSSLTINPLN